MRRDTARKFDELSLMKYQLFSVCIVSLFIFCGVVFAQTPNEIYQKANLNYEDENYKKAISLYKMLIKMDRVSPEVFYNLGNSYFKLKEIGHAIVNYERALRLAPRDRDAKLNLKLAQSMAIDKIKAPQKGFLLSVILFLYDRMNINELTLFVSVVYLGIILLLIFSIFMDTKREAIFYSSGALAVLLVVFGIFLILKIHSYNFVKEAVVISEKVDVRSGPKKDYLLQFTLHEGTILHVIEERQDWYEIALSKDLRGWLPKDNVEVI